MIAKYDGKCRKCGAGFHSGDSIRYSNLTKQTFCIGCWGSNGVAAATTAAERLAAAVQTASARHAEQTEPVPAGERFIEAPVKACGHTTPCACQSPENGLGQAQPAPLPVESSDTRLTPLAAAPARPRRLPGAALKTREAATPYSLFIAACTAQKVATYRPILDDGERGAGCTADNPCICSHDPHQKRTHWLYSGDGLGTWTRIRTMEAK